jgi:putative Holliday junction resolvase
MSAGPARTILAFDFGLRRIGVAVGNTLTGTARPLTTLLANDGVPEWQQIARICAEYAPALCLVGVPCNMDGSTSPLTPRARAFAAELGKRVRSEVLLLDERLSSHAAEEALRDARATGSRARRLRRGDVDQVAAALLLMQWLRQPSASPG